MEYLRYVTELIRNPILDLVMSVVGILFVSLVFFLIQIAFTKPFYGRVTDVDILGFKYTRPKGGNWEYRGYRFRLGFFANSVVDFDNHPGVENKKLIAMEKTHMLITGILTALIGIGVFAGCTAWCFRIYYRFPAALVFLSGFWILMYSIGRIVLVIATVKKMYSKKSLGGYMTSAAGMLRAGIPFEKMDLKSVRELNYPKVWDTERKMYFPIYFSYLDANGLYDRMPEAVADVEAVLKPGERSKVAIAVLMTLVYYYSYHHIEPSVAKEYYHRMGDEIEKDTDCNTMRIKGFYELNCFGNADKARECATAALAKLDSFSVPAERDYERKCIARLNSAISGFLSGS
ncbi:MAG: hypothetical protein IKG03_04460 [Clostridiales bacterium]|nr:hypothetical protein [Clostridiales bacterium]